jgi:uroporphyrinogen-III synthase
MMRVVVTRPQQDSERTAAALRARCHEVLIAPLLQIEPVDAELRTNWSGVIVTSANAINAIVAHPARETLVKLRVYAVGEASAEAARQTGFCDVVTAGGSVGDLVRILAARRVGEKPLLYLAGEDRAADLSGELAAHGIAAEMAVVYRAVVTPFPQTLIKALTGGEVDAVLHFSRRSAESYLTGARKAGVIAPALAVRHICLSAQIATLLSAAGANTVAIAARPDEAALLASLETSRDS